MFWNILLRTKKDRLRKRRNRRFKRRATETQTERGKATKNNYVVLGRQSETFPVDTAGWSI